MRKGVTAGGVRESEKEKEKTNKLSRIRWRNVGL